MKRITEDLETIGEKIRFVLSLKDKAREKALSLCREVVRYSTNAIRAIHRREYEEATSLLDKARSLLDEINLVLKEHPDLLYSGYIFDAQKEYAEGKLTLALTLGKEIPSPEQLGVGYAPYLNGLGEAVGELRRYLLDSIRREDFSKCEELLSVMDDIYGILVTMDFPEALTGGLRRTTDIVRGILERTRGDLTIAFEQRGLGKKLESLEQRLKKGNE